MNIGIVYNKDGKIVNHRSLIKVILNPFLRLIGLQIATIYDKHKNKLFKPIVMKTKKQTSINFKYLLDDDCSVKKERMFI